MEEKKESLIIACTLLGGVADIIAILAFCSEKVSTFIAIPIVILLAALSYLYTMYKNRCDFLHFIKHLTDNNINRFTLLPKICLALDSSKDPKIDHIDNLIVEHIYNFESANNQVLTRDSTVTYPGTIEYNITAQRKKIPDDYSCYLGDIYSTPSFSFYQKHGCQTDYQSVPVPEKGDDNCIKSTVTHFCWQLDKRNITHDRTFPISFKMNLSGKTKAIDDQTLVIYPRQYGKVVDKVTFRITFKFNKDIIVRAEFFKIWKEGHNYKHTSVSGVDISNNTAKISFYPNKQGYEAYYFRIYYDLT